MELSPKQQAVNEITKARTVLVLGHKKPDGDHLGSVLALSRTLKELGKEVVAVVSDRIETKYSFLPDRDGLRDDFSYSADKTLKIDTEKIPIKGMKWQREGKFLNIYLDTEKNLKFEFIELENGSPKPDLVIVVDTPDVESVDAVYDKNPEIFFETPIVNIDHHASNEYYGTVNLVDLTATSTAEILVSLFEALGTRVDDVETATNLLAGIIYKTQSFRNQNTTPKSLTVAAQLLAAGAKQQEIIANFYKQKPVELLKVWGEMLSRIKEDKAHRFAWTKVSAEKDENITKEDVFGAADDLLTNTPEADIVLILFKGANEDEPVYGKLKGSKKKEVLSIARLFGGGGTALDALFEYQSDSLESAEKNILKKIADFWQKDEDGEKKEVWEVIDRDEKEEEPDKGEKTENKDAIEEALKSISQIEKDKDHKELTSIRDVIDKKKVKNDQGPDVFDEEDQGS